MRITITAHRLREPVSDYTVLVRTCGAGSVDVSFWLNDAQARELALQLFAACQPTPAAAPATSATTQEAAA